MSPIFLPTTNTSRLIDASHPHPCRESPKSGYERDWTGRFSGQSICVVRPAGADEVAKVVRECLDRGIPVVPQGGATSLVAGSVPPPDGERPIILSLRRLAWVGAVDAPSQQVTVGAGLTLAQLQATARDLRLEFGVDMASRDSATVGGMIATNAGGIQVVAHGMMRDQVLGLETVLADGSVIARLGGLVKDNTGYDLASLMAGSEGTLGVVTAARVRLRPVPAVVVATLVSMDSVSACIRVLPELRNRVGALRSVELMLEGGLAVVCDTLGLRRPSLRPGNAYLLVEAGGDNQDVVLKSLDEALSSAAGLLDVAVAMDTTDRGKLWAYREMHTEAVARLGVPHKMDISVPLARLEEFLQRLPMVVGAHRTMVWGHLNEGSLHVNVIGPPIDDESVDVAVLRLAVDHGGSISSEHGIGRAKAHLLQMSRSADEIRIMRSIKRALDPSGILNPGVLLAG